jgi:hypothetical protein
MAPAVISSAVNDDAASRTDWIRCSASNRVPVAEGVAER